MSVMGVEPVGLDFNVSGNYTATMSQMIAQADQYAKSADTMIGRVASLNVGITMLIQKTNALTGANKIAVAEAAAYQQRLSGIEATTRVTGRSFDSLSSSALKLARETGRLGESVRIVETLGTSGITAEKSVASLAKAWSNLGAANGLDPVALGQGMLNLGRTFGNSEAQLRSFGDSLTTVTKKWGASAQGTVAFANALAPVAASVGVTQAAVIGLGAAADRVGVEGFAGVNAFSKVLLDMGRSIRTGSPEIKEYAVALGTTEKALAGLFKQNPTEVLVQFTEAIGKGGPAAIRTLETLGLDATRTIRSIQAISGQGNLRKIVEEATASYGNDSTSKAAEVALGGVNDSMAKLTETMAQTVAGAGRPFLGYMEKVLDVSTAIAEQINKIVNSDFSQKLGQVGAVAGFGGSVALNTVSTIGLLGLAKTGLNAGQRGLGTFREGITAGRAGVYQPDAPMLARMGMGYGRQVADPLFGPASGTRVTAGQVLRGTANWAAIAATSQARMMDPLTGRTTPYSGPGQALRGEMGAVWGGRGAGMGGLSGALKDSGVAVAQWTKQVTTANNSMSTLSKSLVRLAGATAVGGANVAGGAVGLLGRGMGALGINPWVAGIGAGIAGGMAVKSWKDNQDAIGDRFGTLAEGGANSTFNEFAAAAGLASRGLVTLAETIEKTTQQIAATNPDVTETGTLTEEQKRQTRSPEYKRAFSSESDDPTRMAARARLMLGPNPTAEELSRVGMDVENQYPGMGDKMLGEFNKIGKNGYRAGLDEVWQSFAWNGRTDETGDVAQEIMSEATRNVDMAKQVYGASAQDPASISEAAKIYSAAIDPVTGRADNRRGQVAAESISTLLGGVNPEYIQSALSRKGTTFEDMVRSAMSGQAISGQSGQTNAPDEFGRGLLGAAAGYLNSGTTDLATVNPGSVGEVPQAITAANDLAKTFTRVNGVTTTWTSAMYEAETKARQYGTTVEGLSDAQVAAMSDVGGAVTRFVREMNVTNLAGAGNAVSRAALAGTGNSPAMSQQQIIQAMAGLGANDPRRQVYGEALTSLQSGAANLNRGMGTYQRQQGVINAGEQYRGMERPTDPQARAAVLAGIDAEQQMYGERIDFMKQYIQADKQLTIQLKDQAEDREITISRMTQDFNKQKLRSQQDFNRSMRRMSEDAAKSIYEPYTRIQAQTVWDAGSLSANLAEQNAAIAKQTTEVDRLKEMGLSQKAVDTLSLGDSKNAQQTSRMLQDAMANPAVIAEINRLIKIRGENTTRATQNENNVAYRRSSQDFKRSLSRSEADFRLSMERMDEDLAKTTRRAYRSLALLGDEVADDLVGVADDFLSRVEKLPLSIRDQMSANLKLTISSAAADAKAAWDLALEPYGLDSTILNKVVNAWTTYRQQTQGNGSAGSTGGGVPSNDGGAQGGGVTGRVMVNPFPSAYQTQGYSRAHGGLDLSSAPGDADAGAVIRAIAPGRVTGATHSSTSGGVIEITHGNGFKSRYHHLNAKGFYVRAGDSVAAGQHIGSLGLTKLSVGSNASDYGMGGSHNTGAHLHLALLKTGSFIDPTPYWKGQKTFFSQGGIGTKQMDATIGESGHPEAVIPLDDRGASFLANAMGRYVDGSRVQQARVQPYATSTSSVSYSYDQRVMVTGPVSVQAQDPMEFSRRMAAKARQDRLVQPVGR